MRGHSCSVLLMVVGSTMGFIPRWAEAVSLVQGTAAGLARQDCHLSSIIPLPPMQVTLSYGMFENKRNAVHIKGPFSVEADPSR